MTGLTDDAFVFMKVGTTNMAERLVREAPGVVQSVESCTPTELKASGMGAVALLVPAGFSGHWAVEWGVGMGCRVHAGYKERYLSVYDESDTVIGLITGGIVSGGYDLAVNRVLANPDMYLDNDSNPLILGNPWFKWENRLTGMWRDEVFA